VRNVLVYPTGKCNLECKYCFARRSQWAREDSTEEVMLASVDFLLAESGENKQVTLGFFGGEPLLRPDLVDTACEYARLRTAETDTVVSFAATTNLTLLDDTICAMLRKWDVELVASIDGLPHAGNERFWPGTTRSSAPEAFRKLLLAQQAGLRFNIRWTITPNQLAFLADDTITLAALGFRLLTLEFVYEAPWTPAALEQLEAQLRLIAGFYIEELRAGRELEIKPFRDAFKLYTMDRPCPTRCGFGVGGVGIAPNGDIQPCVRFVSRADAAQWNLGNVLTGFDREKRDQVAASWDRERIKVADGRECRDCPVRLRCPGGICPPLHIDVCGDFYTVPSGYCDTQLVCQRVANDVLGILYGERNPFMLRALGQKPTEGACACAESTVSVAALKEERAGG